MIQFRQEKYFHLREKYPLLTYESMDYFVENHELKLKYRFTTNEITYAPEITIPLKSFFLTKHASEIEGNPLIENIVFHIGMIELISYWKATCSPNILIKPFHLNEDQINWWKKIYFLGLGEFFYLNGVQNTIHDFVSIKSEGSKRTKPLHTTLKDEIIVPIGGGKDSVVTLELLLQTGNILNPLILNPRGATLQTVSAAGIDQDSIIEIYRKIDNTLLELNSKGYLNGHTPFSALLGFVCLLAAVLTGKQHVALSNESSANESTVVDTDVKHQYSKSFQFEQDFRSYTYKFISQELNYFSFLRPLSEIQIAKLFSRFEKYHSVFKSCNVGSKMDIWCGNCPKCLFTFIMLSPFIEKDKMVNIFGSDLLDNQNLLSSFDELIGISEVKPFECVGTIEEVNVALHQILKQLAPDKHGFLLSYYQSTSRYAHFKNSSMPSMLKDFNTEHFLLPTFESILKSAIE